MLQLSVPGTPRPHVQRYIFDTPFIQVCERLQSLGPLPVGSRLPTRRWPQGPSNVPNVPVI